jgi:hypothetical protein
VLIFVGVLIAIMLTFYGIRIATDAPFLLTGIEPKPEDFVKAREPPCRRPSQQPAASGAGFVQPASRIHPALRLRGGEQPVARHL